MTRPRERWQRVLRFLSNPAGARRRTFNADAPAESTTERGGYDNAAPRHEAGDDSIPLAELVTASACLGFDAMEFLRPHRPLPDVDMDRR